MPSSPLLSLASPPPIPPPLAPRLNLASGLSLGSHPRLDRQPGAIAPQTVHP
ncbi:MAG: hypothetical protein HC824_08770 [Synechococcales cyanobacterium RM1_1_8]|nr:hypothetical protein [Synechococcales cyanobacterium RM1_1_8]